MGVPARPVTACSSSAAASRAATSLSRKLRVVVDWTVALFFRRDIAELGGLGHPRGLRDG